MNITPTRKKHLLQIAQIIGLAILAVSFALSFVVAEEQPGFSGFWQRNEDESDDPEEKFKEAMEAMRSQMGGRGGRPGMGGRGGMEGRGRRPGGMMGGPGGLSDLGAEIETVLENNEFQVVPSGEGRVRIFYLDGEKHMREAPNGSKIETTSEKKGNRILVEEKTEQDAKIHTTYELAPDGSRMVVTVQFEGGRMKEPIIIRTVYDSVSGEASS
jgi:hypothetical protein